MVGDFHSDLFTFGCQSNHNYFHDKFGDYYLTTGHNTLALDFYDLYHFVEFLSEK
jgi:hypothetical protein